MGRVQRVQLVWKKQEAAAVAVQHSTLNLIEALLLDICGRLFSHWWVFFSMCEASQKLLSRVSEIHTTKEQKSKRNHSDSVRWPQRSTKSPLPGERLVSRLQAGREAGRQTEVLSSRESVQVQRPRALAAPSSELLIRIQTQYLQLGRVTGP